jgi:Mrp family chromosome partitioning ATPase
LDERKPEGLGSVIAGEIELEDALRTLDVGGGELRVLPAGFPPPNPSELLGSEQMFALLADLSESSDLVILDTPPIAHVSDAIALLHNVDGVLLAVSVSSTRDPEARRLRDQLQELDANVLGVVANGGTAQSGYGYAGSAERARSTETV